MNRLIRLTARATMALVMLGRMAFAGDTHSWSVSTETDALTDAVRTVASVTNEEGFSFSIYRSGGKGTVWANFSLPNAEPAVLDPQRLIQFRVDHNPPDNLDVLRRFAPEFLDGQPKFVNFAVSGPYNRGEATMTLRRLQKGSKLLVRFYSLTGSYRDTSFELTGARHAIAVAAGVPETWDESAQEEEEQKLGRRTRLDAAWAMARNRCSGSGDNQAQLKCTMKMGDCKRASPSADDSEAKVRVLLDCLEAVDPRKISEADASARSSASAR